MRDNKLMLNTARQMQLVGSDSVVEGKMSLLLNNGVVLPLKAQINTGGGGGDATGLGTSSGNQVEKCLLLD